MMAMDTPINSQITDSVASSTVNSQITDLLWSIPSSSIVKSNYQIDKHLKLATNPDSMVFIETGNECAIETITIGNLKLPVQAKPVACFRKFMSSETVVGTQQYQLSKKKGYSSTFSCSVSVKASIGSTIGVCETSLEVTTEFGYSTNSYEETTETWTNTLDTGSYTLYQNVMLYAFKVDAAADPAIMEIIKKDSPDMEFHQRSVTQEWYFFVPTYMNNPFTIEYSKDTYDPVAEEDLIDYLLKDGYSKWNQFKYELNKNKK